MSNLERLYVDFRLMNMISVLRVRLSCRPSTWWKYTFETNTVDYILQPHVFSLSTETIEQSPDNKSLCHGMEKTIGETSTVLVGHQRQLTFTHNMSTMSKSYVRDINFMLSLLKTHWHADYRLPIVRSSITDYSIADCRLFVKIKRLLVNIKRLLIAN